LTHAPVLTKIFNSNSSLTPVQLAERACLNYKSTDLFMNRTPTPAPTPVFGKKSRLRIHSSIDEKR